MASKTITPSLEEKGTLVQVLWEAVDGGSGVLANIPGLVSRVIETEAWKKRVHDGRIYEHKRFIDFIASPPKAGCGWNPAKVEALIKDEPEVLERWRQAITPENHRPLESNDNVITSSQGNARAYTLSRLKREAPELFDKVVRKELSANAAAIQAGFRIKSITVPLDRERAVAVLSKYFTEVEIGELK